MDELGQMILGSSQSSTKREPTFDEIKAAKKRFSGVNPQLQAEPDGPDELGQLILGGGSAPKKQERQLSATETAMQKAYEMRQQLPGFISSAADIVAGAPSAVAQTVGYGAGRLFGLSPQEAEAAAGKVAKPLSQPVGRLTGTAETQGYQQALPTQVMEYIGQHLNEGAESISRRFGLPVQDVQQGINALLMAAPAVARPVARGLAEAKAALPTVRIEQVGKPGMQSGGAAATTNQALLQEAINRATPELAAELKTIDPNTVNPVVLENYVRADQLPVPVRLTKGQATGDPNLISVERNERGLKPQLAEQYAAQNRALAENAELIKQKAGADTHEVNYVGNSERAIDTFKEISTEADKAIAKAYKDLEDLGAGKIEFDSKSFGDSAMKALTENEDIDFLPSTIKNKIEAYQGGKSMNFAQYENLRTQIARETRKAQKADDGNAVHALTIARSELEKLPLLNETAEAKAVADVARSLAAQEFGLLDRRRPTYNPVYADIVNGAADTKDFIPKVVLRSKNADFAKAMDMLEAKPEGLQQLKAGTLDYMIREATDASGNFKTAKFADMVDTLDVNGKLTRLFGEDAQSLKDLAHVGKLTEAMPRGHFVSTANTAPAAAQLAKQYGMKVAERVPVVGRLVEPASQILAERRLAKEVKETMRPGAGAGTKLKNVGKD